jgi:YfiH family protein
VFSLDSRQLYRSSLLDAVPGLIHGFGTRSVDVPRLVQPLATLKQIHSSTCVAAEGRDGVLGEGDALLESTPGHAVAVKTADCIPILLADPRHRAVAAVHAGWRGTVAEIARRTVEEMAIRFGSLPADLVAAIGPGIGKCCYEVGPEVAAHFGATGRAHVDLAAANARQLEAAGVAPSHIDVAGLCTRCDATLFYSFRRDAEAAGRMFSYIGLR